MKTSFNYRTTIIPPSNLEIINGIFQVLQIFFPSIHLKVVKQQTLNHQRYKAYVPY